MNDIISPENLVYKKPTLMNDTPMHYCPGCSHGVVHKLVAEVIEEMGMEDKTVGVCPVGCAVFAYRYLDIDWQEAAHGRAPAVATGIKRLWPDRLVFTYQGDGDLACIGMLLTTQATNIRQFSKMIEYFFLRRKRQSFQYFHILQNINPFFKTCLAFFLTLIKERKRKIDETKLVRKHRVTRLLPQSNVCPKLCHLMLLWHKIHDANHINRYKLV